MANSQEIAGFFVILSHPQLEQKVPFYYGTNIIGRNQLKASVVIKELSISQKHARLIVDSHSLKLADLGSKNGTMINSNDNRLKKDEEVMVDETMVIYFAEAKCKIQLNRPKKITSEVKKEVREEENVLRRDEVMQMFEDESKANLLKQQHKIKPKVQTKPLNNEFKKIQFKDFCLDENLSEIKETETKPEQKKKETKKGKGKSKQSKNSLELEPKPEKKVNEKKQKKKAPSLQKPVQQRASQIPSQRQVSAVSNKATKSQKMTSIKPGPNSARKRKPIMRNSSNIHQRQIQQNNLSVPTKSDQNNLSSKQSNSKPETIQEEDNEKLSQHAEEPQRRGRKSMASKDEKKVSKPKEEKKSKSTSPIKKTENIKIKITKPPKKANAEQRPAPRHNMNLTVANIDKQSSRTMKKPRKRKLSQSLDRDEKFYRENKIIPPRRQKLGRRVIVSGFTCTFERNLFKIVEDYKEPFDYLVMRSYTRTFKALIAICRGIYIVKEQWIKLSENLMQPLNAKSFCFKDIAYVYDAIERVAEGFKVFDQYEIYLASEVYHMDSDKIKELIQYAGGSIMPKTTKNIQEKKKASTIAIVCNETKENKQKLKGDIRTAKKIGFDKIYSIELILDSCERQKINWSANVVSLS